MDHSLKRVFQYYPVMDSNQYPILIIRITTHFFQFRSHQYQCISRDIQTLFYFEKDTLLYLEGNAR
jgi:hypothetical protein